MKKENQSLPISKWQSKDQPRERLMNDGKHTVSNAELIAVQIRSGTRTESAVTLAKKILAFYDNNLGNLSTLSVEQLCTFKGIGEAKAVAIISALELGRRCQFETREEKPIIKSSNKAFELLHPKLGGLRHEEFWVIYLSNSNKVLHMMQISKGGLTGTVVDVRLVLAKALELKSVGLILAHNHPSGSLNPSVADKRITEKLVTAAQTLDIKVLDHLILTEKDYFSFADGNEL